MNPRDDTAAARGWRRALRQLALIPLVAIGSYFLMASLPLVSEDEAKRRLPPDLVSSYRRDLGIGEPLGFFRPWQKLIRGDRLGTSSQGVTGPELLEKLVGSLGVGLFALGLAMAWALAFALFRLRLEQAGHGWGDLVPALAFGTPVFIPALLIAPYVVERGHLLPELSAALVISCWPGIFLGNLTAQALRSEISKDYVRTAVAKGVDRWSAVCRHALPNVVPVFLDSVGPSATALLAGSFAAERVFGLPYFGQLYVLAVLQKQIAVVVVATTAFAGVLVLVTVAVEALRHLADPRLREGV